MSDKSRADYFRKRRESYKQFCVNLDRPLIERLEKHLEEKGITRTDWLKQKISEELGE